MYFMNKNHLHRNKNIFFSTNICINQYEIVQCNTCMPTVVIVLFYSLSPDMSILPMKHDIEPHSRKIKTFSVLKSGT